MSKHLEELQRRAIEASRTMDDGRLFDEALTELFALHQRAGLDHMRLHLGICMDCRHNGVEIRLSAWRFGPWIRVGLMEPFADISREELRKRWAEAFAGNGASEGSSEWEAFGLTRAEMDASLMGWAMDRATEGVTKAFEQAAANGNKIAYTTDGVQTLADVLKRSLPEVKGLEFVGAEVIPGSPDAVSVSYRMPPVIEPVTVSGWVKLDDPAPIPMSAQSFCRAIECVGELARDGCEANSQRIDDAASRNLISMDHAMRLMGSPQVVNNRREELLHIIGQDPWELGGFFNVEEAPPAAVFTGATPIPGYPDSMSVGYALSPEASEALLAGEGVKVDHVAALRAAQANMERTVAEMTARNNTPEAHARMQKVDAMLYRYGHQARDLMAHEGWEDMFDQRGEPTISKHEVYRLLGIQPYDPNWETVPEVNLNMVSLMKDPEPGCEINREGTRVSVELTPSTVTINGQQVDNSPRDPEQGERIQAIKDQWRGDR